MTSIETATELTATFRAAESALRGISRRDGRTAATINATLRHQRSAEQAMNRILAGMEHNELAPLHRELVGLLVSEADVAQRLLDAGLAGQDRPELKARQVATRRQIREILAATECVAR